MWNLPCCVWSPCSSSWSFQVEMWGLLLSLHLSLCPPVQSHFHHVFNLWIFSSRVYSFTEPTWRVLDLGYHTFFQLLNFFLVPLTHFHLFLGVFKFFSCFKSICRYLMTFFYKPTFRSLSDNFNSAIIESMLVSYYLSNPGWDFPASLTDKCLSGMP